MTGSLGLLVLSIMLGFFLPSVPQPSNGVRTSNHAFSRAALMGRDIYLEEGCGSCHTQLIRNVVPDAKLGPVTLDDTNQVIGYRRIGPDLAAIGSRITDTAALTALLAGEGNHPTAALSDSELADLVAYLRESR
jgi:cbb3-type cytochrome oxidase cytochrome c subunit